MQKIIVAIPAVCEGVDNRFIDELSEKLRNVEGLALLDVSMDNVRNRTSFSYSASEKRPLLEAGEILYEESKKKIDMRNHKGEYPRIGAVDVVPFVPVSNATIEEVMEIADEFAEMVAEKFDVPVYLFGKSAKLPQREDIDEIRDCEYEGLEERLGLHQWRPDLGTDRFIPDFGATIIGARYPLVKFKVFLDTKDEVVANFISSSVRSVNGGLKHIKAYTGMDKDSGKGIITVTDSDYVQTPVHKVIEMIRFEAKRYGVLLRGVEMVGLIPEKVYYDSAAFYMGINDFREDRVAEKAVARSMFSLNYGR